MVCVAECTEKTIYNDDMKTQSVADAIEKCLRDNEDLPILRVTAVDILKVVENPLSTATELARVILRDQGFTVKVLKVANSIYYNPSVDDINTISRAVVILGIEMIRSISLGLAFVETFQQHHPGVDLKKIVANGLIAANMAKEIAKKINYPKSEEMFICALLYNIGSMTVAYQMPDKYLQVKDLIETRGLSQTEAEEQILGFTSKNLGTSLARQWNLPDTLTEALESTQKSLSTHLLTPKEHLGGVTTLANEITNNLFTESGTEQELEGLLEKFDVCFKVDKNDGLKIIKESYKKVKALSETFEIEAEKFRPQPSDIVEDDTPQSSRNKLLSRLEVTYEKGVDEEDDKGDEEKSKMEGESELIDNLLKEPSKHELQLKFLREITLHLYEDNDISMLFNAVLEGICRGIGFDRTVLALCDAKKTQVTGRISIGIDAKELSEKLKLPILNSSNIFEKVMNEKQPVLVDNIDSNVFRNFIPNSFVAAFKMKSFVLSPIHSRGNVIGFFYADNAPSHRTIGKDDFQAFQHFSLQANIGLDRKATRSN